jgi:hypothetical protein
MTKAEKQIIRKWAKLRHWDFKNVEKSALTLYNSLELYDKKKMIKEFSDYIEEVKSGKIDAEPVKLKIPVFRNPKDEKTEKELRDYYNGN